MNQRPKLKRDRRYMSHTHENADITRVAAREKARRPARRPRPRRRDSRVRAYLFFPGPVSVYTLRGQSRTRSDARWRLSQPLAAREVLVEAAALVLRTVFRGTARARTREAHAAALLLWLDARRRSGGWPWRRCRRGGWQPGNRVVGAHALLDCAVPRHLHVDLGLDLLVATLERQGIARRVLVLWLVRRRRTAVLDDGLEVGQRVGAGLGKGRRLGLGADAAPTAKPREHLVGAVLKGRAPWLTTRCAAVPLLAVRAHGMWFSTSAYASVVAASAQRLATCPSSAPVVARFGCSADD